MTNKKKVIYKKGTDGIFRVHDFIRKDDNELINCQYTIQPQGNHHSHQKEGTNSATPYPKRYSDIINDVNQQLPLDIAGKYSENKDISGRPLDSTSFVYGMFAGGILVSYFPQCNNLTMQIYDAIKSIIALAAALAIIGWYLGVIKPEDSKIFQRMASCKELTTHDRNENNSISYRPNNNNKNVKPRHQHESDIPQFRAPMFNENKSSGSTPPSPKQVYSTPKEIRRIHPSQHAISDHLSKKHVNESKKQLVNTSEHWVDVKSSRSYSSESALSLADSKTSSSSYFSEKGICQHKDALQESSKDLPPLPTLHCQEKLKTSSTTHDLKYEKSILGTKEKYDIFVSKVNAKTEEEA